MLGALRKYSSGKAIKIFYGLLALSFIGWGASTRLFGENRLDVVADVQGQRITRGQLDDATYQLERRFQNLFRGAVPAGIDFRGQALQQLVDEALLRHEADRLGIEVSDDDVVHAIMTMPELQENGRFNRDLLERVLRLQRDRGEFENQIREDLMSQRARNLVLDGVTVSDAELASRWAFDKDQVNLLVVRIPGADLAKDVTPSDDELNQWLRDHEAQYRLPPRVRARYVAYRPDDFAALATPSDQAVKDYYDQHAADRFTTPEEVHARHILVRVAPDADDTAKADARKKADGLLAKVRGGADFAATAKASSDDPGSAAQGGDLGFFGRGRMVPAFDAVAFATPAGQISEIVETPYGFHIIKVEEKREAGTKPLDAVKDEIVTTLRKEKGLELARQQAESDRRAIVGGKPLAEAVGGRTVSETPAFAQDAVVPGVGRVKAFNAAAFALGIDEPSDLVESDDAVYLLEPIERLDPALPPLADVRDRVVADVRRARGETLAKEKAEALRTRAAEVGLAQAAKDQGLTVDETGAFERSGGPIPKIGAAPELRADVFQLDVAKPLAPKVYAVGGDAVVVALKEKIPADPAGLAAEKDQLREALLQEKQQIALEQFMTFLKEQAQKAGALQVKANAVGRG